jgi:hypothetical protein
MDNKSLWTGQANQPALPAVLLPYRVVADGGQVPALTEYKAVALSLAALSAADAARVATIATAIGRDETPYPPILPEQPTPTDALRAWARLLLSEHGHEGTDRRRRPVARRGRQPRQRPVAHEVRRIRRPRR